MRHCAFFLAVMLIFGCACQAEASRLLRIGTGSVGGAYYPVGTAIAAIWNSIDGLTVTAEPTGGTINNIQLLGDGDAEICLADGTFYDAYYGTGPYRGNPQKFFQAIVAVYPEVFHIVAAKDSGIHTLYDMKGRRISVGPQGGSIKPSTDMILRAAGMRPEDITPEFLSFADTVVAFADKRIDGAVLVGSLGITSIVDATTQGLVNFLPLPEKIVVRVCKEAPYFAPYTIPADTYAGQTGPVPTLSSPNIVAVHEKLDAELVYQLTRLLFEHKAALTAISANMIEMTPEAITAIKIPIHPGAEKYYRELGIMK